MDILFRTDKLRRLCNDDRVAMRSIGANGAKRLRQRLDDLAAAGCLEDMRTLPGRCHELKGDRAGQLAMDLDGGRRLTFEPATEPRPKKVDGGLDWRGVTSIRVVEVGDYHV